MFSDNNMVIVARVKKFVRNEFNGKKSIPVYEECDLWQCMKCKKVMTKLDV
jgi:hypothetical protein